MAGLDFDGRTMVVTGAANGLGRAVAFGAAVSGADLAVIDRDAEALASLTEEVTALGRRVHAEVGDVRSADVVEGFVAGAAQVLGGIDVVVNNAGGTFRALFDDIAPKGRDALIAENFTSVAQMCAAARPHLAASAHPSVVNVTSIEAHRACPGFAVYAAMKAAVENLTASLAVEWGHLGIRVNCVAPDAIPTDGELFLGMETSSDYDHTTPLGRLGRVDEIVGPVLFLASDLSSFMTGTTLHVDGGNDAARGWRRRPDGSFKP